MEYTIAIIKPDVSRMPAAAKILDIIYRQPEKYRVLALSWVQMPTVMWKEFYTELADRPFFDELVSFMASEPVFILVLEGEDVVRRWRDDIGPTDPKKADVATIRGLFGDKNGPMMRNAVHGSASVEDAARELGIIRYWDRGARPRIFAPMIFRSTPA
jgi:nucleoside-diphosphate kinase